MKKKLLYSSLLGLTGFTTFVNTVRAQDITGDDDVNIAAIDGAITSVESLISGGVTLIFFAAGLIAFFYLILGGIKWITAAGDTSKVEEARNQIIQALVGILIVLAAWALIALIQQSTDACFGIGCTIVLPTFS